MKVNMCVLASTLVISACSSVVTVETPRSSDGLTYYMPKKDFLVTVVKKAGVIETVTLDTSPAYPDYAKSYVLTHGDNLIGKNKLTVTVGPSGLLQTTAAKTTSGLSEALRNLGESLGAISPFGVLPSERPADGCGDGTHIFAYDGPVLDASGRACGLVIRIMKLPSITLPSHGKTESVGHSGVFYRQAEPYRMEAAGVLNKSAVVLSPSYADVQFLPISRTLFSNNAADFGFKDGMPEKYDQETEGELIGLLKLPADVIGAYFTAVGKIFGQLKTREVNEAEALKSALNLELAKRKYDACVQAIKEKDESKQEKLACSK